MAWLQKTQQPKTEQFGVEYLKRNSLQTFVLQSLDLILNTTRLKELRSRQFGATGAMRDAEESESEKSWKSEDEADGIRRDIPNDARSRAFEPQPKPSAGRGMSAVLPSYMQGNNPALTQSFGHGKAKKAPEPESEPSMDCSSEPSLRTTVTRTDPSDDEEPQDPWHVHGDPWQKSEPSKPSTRTRQDPGTSGTWGHDRYEQLHGKREAQNVHNGQNGNPRGPDPWADGDPWGGTSASKSQDPKQDPRDPWQGGNDPWSGSTRQDGKGGKNGDWFAKGKGSPGPEGGKPAKGKGKGEPHDPWLMNDPWGAAAGKGRNPDGKGKAVQGESRNGPSSWPQQLATVPGHAEPRREAPIQPARPKPTPPKPPSSDGEESSQRSNGGKWNRHMRTAARAPGIGPDGLPAHDAQKDKYLQYRKRCLDLLGTNYKGQTVEVQANKQIQVPGFLRCEMDEILLLRFVTDGFALLEDFPSRVGARMGPGP